MGQRTFPGPLRLLSPGLTGLADLFAAAASGRRRDPLPKASVTLPANGKSWLASNPNKETQALERVLCAWGPKRDDGLG